MRWKERGRGRRIRESEGDGGEGREEGKEGGGRREGEREGGLAERMGEDTLLCTHTRYGAHAQSETMYPYHDASQNH